MPGRWAPLYSRAVVLSLCFSPGGPGPGHLCQLPALFLIYIFTCRARPKSGLRLAAAAAIGLVPAPGATAARLNGRNKDCGFVAARPYFPYPTHHEPTMHIYPYLNLTCWQLVRRPIKCTHFDAFRHFTDAAKPLNSASPPLAPERRLDNEQGGCLHANCDLFKWALKLGHVSCSHIIFLLYIYMD